MQRDLQASLLEAAGEDGGVDSLADAQQGWGDFGFGALFHDDEDGTWNPMPQTTVASRNSPVTPPPLPPPYTCRVGLSTYGDT